jgi:hypothetical protein
MTADLLRHAVERLEAGQRLDVEVRAWLGIGFRTWLAGAAALASMAASA